LLSGFDSQSARTSRTFTACRREALVVSRLTDPERIVTSPAEPAVPVGHPMDAEIEAERAGWNELLELIHSLDPIEIARPGYYREPDWSVVDLVAHLGMWLAEAGIQLERIQAGTYVRADIDIDALNAEFRTGMHGQPWSVVLTQAQAARYRMLEVWYALPSRGDAAAWWVAKAGAEHYREHLGRLRSWVAKLERDRNHHPA
jgi:hypothetical protein